MMELKPCPLCGEEKVLILPHEGWHVFCSRCACSTANFNSNAKAAAVIAWNNRPSPWVDERMEALERVADAAREKKSNCYGDDWCPKCDGELGDAIRDLDALTPAPEQP